MIFNFSFVKEEDHWRCWTQKNARIDLAEILYATKTKAERAPLLRQGKAEALRKAQLSLMNDPEYKHPYYWAPVILIGDWC